VGSQSHISSEYAGSFAWLLLRRQPVAAIYDGLLRLLCPHVLGGSQVGSMCFCLSVWRQQQQWSDAGRSGDWRCLAVEKLSQVKLRAEAWHTEPRSVRQTCVDEIEFDADAQPGDDPQKGQ